jgi:hypothetical protein
LAHEPLEKGLVSFSPLSAAVTTELAVAGAVHYLAVWRLAVSISGAADSAWERISRVAARGPAYLYVPALSLMRTVVQRLGVSLTEAQPALELHPGLEGGALQRPALMEAGMGLVVNVGPHAGEGDGAPGAAVATEPDFGTFSPVVVGREDARALGHFVYLAVESHEARDLHSVDYELETIGEELLFIPAVWDPRYIHESNWRLLLREFDGLVA